ncbi:MAG: RNA polymerase sigma factor [Bacteroidota bacterium]
MKTANFESQITNLVQELHKYSRNFSRDHEESQDLVQDTILRALTYQSRFKENTNLKGWLYTIMRNIFINKYRKTKYDQTYLDNTETSYHLNVPDNYTHHSPDRNYEYAEMWKNADTINPRWLTPFKLHTSGYSYIEIADQLSVPLGTVKNRIFMARKELQKQLAAQ